MKAQGLWKGNNACGFFMPETVLSGGGSCAYSVDIYLQVYNNANKPSLRGRTGIFRPPAAEGGLFAFDHNYRAGKVNLS